MTGIQPFDYEGTELRTVTVDGEPWFVAADVCAVLGIANGRDAVSRIEPDDVGSTDIIDSLGRTQTARTVNESGLYELVFQSRKPEAKAFRRWVTAEVLPQIRKTGSYSVAEQVPRTLPDALRAYAREVEAHEATLERNRELEPKADYVDRFVSEDDLVLLRDVATDLHIGEPALREFLVEKRWIYKKLIGRRFSRREHKLVDELEWRCYSDRSYAFRLLPQHNAPRHHNNQLRQTLYVTPTGHKAIAEAAERHGLIPKRVHA